MAPRTSSSQRPSAAGLLAAQLDRLPELPAAEEQAPQLFVRIFAPELCDYWQSEEEPRPEEKTHGLDLDLTLALKPHGGQPFSISRLLGLTLAALRQEGLEAEGFDLSAGPAWLSAAAAAEALPAAARGLEARVETALERTEVRSRYYHELRSMAQRAVESMLRMRTDCMRDLDRLRQEVVRLQHGSKEAPHVAENVTFFAVEDFMPPSWKEILQALDELRWSRQKPKSREAQAAWEAAETRDAFQRLSDLSWQRSKGPGEDSVAAAPDAPTDLADAAVQTDEDGLGQLAEKQPRKSWESADAVSSPLQERVATLSSRFGRHISDPFPPARTGRSWTDPVSSISHALDVKKSSQAAAASSAVGQSAYGQVIDANSLSTFPSWSRRTPRVVGTHSVLPFPCLEGSNTSGPMMTVTPMETRQQPGRLELQHPGTPTERRGESGCLEFQRSNCRPRPPALTTPTPTGATCNPFVLMTPGGAIDFPGSVQSVGSSSTSLAGSAPQKSPARAMPSLQEHFVMAPIDPVGVSTAVQLGVSMSVQWSPQNGIMQWTPQNAAACGRTAPSNEYSTSPGIPRQQVISAPCKGQSNLPAVPRQQVVPGVSLPAPFGGLRLTPMMATAAPLVPMSPAAPAVASPRECSSGMVLPALQSAPVQPTLMSMTSPLAKQQLLYRNPAKHKSLPTSKSPEPPQTSAPLQRRPVSTMTARTHVLLRTT
mmetsp:Transcript_82788/g.146243  ORF Transcript_82788/g.146243 Transcript_82788/m.146243 type:complete len:711 (-) Transcript_82788:65-2197(-)